MRKSLTALMPRAYKIVQSRLGGCRGIRVRDSGDDGARARRRGAARGTSRRDPPRVLMADVLVVDPSASVRETLAIVLGHEHAVTTCEPPASVARTPPPALAIVGLPSPPGDRALLAALGSTVPLLLLHRPEDVDATLIVPGARVGFLPKPFDAHALRAAVRRALAPRYAARVPPDGGTRYRRFLEYPFVAREAAARLRHACDVDLPLLVVGEPGCGARDVVRAVHFFARLPPTLRVLTCRALAADELPGRCPPGGGGVVLDGVDQTAVAAQPDVVALLDGHLAAASASPLRVYATAASGLDDAVARGTLLPEIAWALATLPVHLAPLRDRAADLPDLARALGAELAERLGLGEVAFADATMERLAHYLWFGNVAELTSVLARTLALHRPLVVRPEHLVFLPEQADAVAPAPRSAPRAPAPSSTAPTAPRLEVLLGELAHELRNPMATIKTFAQHLDSVLDDPDVRARFATLTSDAVTRMDTQLERLLAFARFRTPVPAPTSLDVLLDRALAACRDDLARKHIRIERNGAVPGTVAVDEAQILFALQSLLGGVLGDLAPHEPVHVTAPAPGALEITARAEPATVARLTAFVEGADEAAAGAETPTLPFALAAALIERNGGHLRVRRGDEGTTIITVALAPAADGDP